MNFVNWPDGHIPLGNAVYRFAEAILASGKLSLRPGNFPTKEAWEQYNSQEYDRIMREGRSRLWNSLLSGKLQSYIFDNGRKPVSVRYWEPGRGDMAISDGFYHPETGKVVPSLLTSLGIAQQRGRIPIWVFESELTEFVASAEWRKELLGSTIAALPVEDEANEGGPHRRAKERRPGGNPGKDWTIFYLEIIKRANGLDGIPKEEALRTAFRKDMHSWCERNIDPDISRSAVYDKLKTVFATLDASSGN